MKTFWGELEVCDAHVHFFSRGFFAAMASQKSDLVAPSGADAAEAVARFLNWDAPPSDPNGLAEIWAAELDRCGVSRAALIASVPGDERSVAAALARYPSRFYGYFMVNPLAPDALERVEGALEAGLRGLCFFPAMHRYSMNDPRVEPILRAVSARTGIVIFVHCGILTIGIRGKLGLASPFDMRYSNPIDLHPIALSYPKLNFVLPHFGAGYLREALMLCALCRNVHLDTSSSNGWMRLQAPALDLKTVFERALDVAGPKRILFGSDSSFFPRGWHAPVYETQTQILQDLGTTREDAQAILGGNLDRLFRQC
jgi:predicted TIM-barrel fold metal-dependent hydrolase